MVGKKPRILIIGAGMAGIVAANRLYTSSANSFELAVVEGGSRIGGRIDTSEFCGDRIELGATWIHGIGGNPVYEIAQDENLLQSEQPWECMNGILEDPVTVAEGGHELDESVVDPISCLFKNLMDFAQGKSKSVAECGGGSAQPEVLKSVGSFLRQGLEAYWAAGKDESSVGEVGCWSRKSLEEAVFAMHEGVQRTYTSAGDLRTLDYSAERDYVMFPGEEITIAKGYSSVIESLASVLPAGMVQLNRKVERIEWKSSRENDMPMVVANGHKTRPVKLHFSDGSTDSADHIIITVSLGVLKHGIRQDSLLFHPPLPGSKIGCISRLGYGVVNKVFLQMSPQEPDHATKFPFVQMAFHPPDSLFRNMKIPQWIRKTSFICPIYNNSRVLLSWFAGQEALELESLTDEEIITGFSSLVSDFLPSKSQSQTKPNPNESLESSKPFDFSKVLRTQWGTNPLFLGSYSYVAVGSSLNDIDILAEPLPSHNNNNNNNDHLSLDPPLQILFAGEATHKTHYSTTHGAYYSGLREANRLLKLYNSAGA